MNKIRTTITGVEYWDKEKKKVILIPKAKKERIDLKTYTIAQLKEYASNHNITIPEDLKKKDDIINLISDVK